MIARSPVLVLNATYEPVQVSTVRRALVLVLKGIATVEAAGEGELRSARGTTTAPSVIRLVSYRRIPRGAVSASRHNILLRDRNTCQYCGVVFRPLELTLDHVVPRSRGGLATWENLVACCAPCNRRKADRTPEEARMALRRRPRASTALTSRLLLRATATANGREWTRWLFV